MSEYCVVDSRSITIFGFRGYRGLGGQRSFALPGKPLHAVPGNEIARVAARLKDAVNEGLRSGRDMAELRLSPHSVALLFLDGPGDVYGVIRPDYFEEANQRLLGKVTLPGLAVEGHCFESVTILKRPLYGIQILDQRGETVVRKQ